ncbi:MAG: DUF4747 family protein [Bacteroides sp.]|nr:DUF4747 family protein [Bacteroides sp.]
MDKILNRQTTWYLINIKARREQTTEHYVQAFRRLYKQDPLVGFPRGGKAGSLKYVSFSNILDQNGNPNWIQIGLLSYTIIDPEAFYNKRSQEDVTMANWNEDIVANKKETDLYFIPSVHTLAVRCNSDISLKNIVFYLSEALDRVEPETFDIDVIIERDILDKILNAYAITHLYANISYSNPGHTQGFEAAFDSKLREMGASRIEFTATGSKEYPLNRNNDGMLQSLVNISERNGYVQATIQATQNTKFEKVDSSEHPRKLVIPQIVNDICSTIYNAIRGIIQ